MGGLTSFVQIANTNDILQNWSDYKESQVYNSLFLYNLSYCYY